MSIRHKHPLNNFATDLRVALLYAIRQLLRAPSFAIPVIVTLAIGIGVNTAIFSATYALLLKSLPFRDSARLVSIVETHPQVPGGVEATFPDYLDWRAQQSSFEQLSAFSTLNPETVTVVVNGIPSQVHRTLASANFFTVLGVSPALGRVFNESDDRPGGNHVAILSATAWRRHFGATPEISGRSVTINGADFTVIGVMPDGAALPSDPADGEIWMPLSLLDQPTQASRVWHSVRVIGRLRPGVTLQQARTDLRAIASRIALQYPATNRAVETAVTPLREQLTGTLRPALISLAGCAVLVFLVACANVANLMLMWMAKGRREVAIRQALGASRSRLFIQSLTTTTLLSLAGFLLGSFLAALSIPLLRLMLANTAGADSQMIASIALNIPVLLFAFAMSLLCALIFSAVSATHLPSRIAGVLGGGDRSITRSGSRGRAALIVAQVALAVVVLFLSALFVRSFGKLMSVDPGYRVDHLLTMEMTLPEPRYSDSSIDTEHFYERVLEKIVALPGVQSAATTTQVPLHPSQVMTRFLVAGAPAPAAGLFPFAQMRYVSPDFFTTLGLSLVHGRVFSQDDVRSQGKEVVVNQSFARKFLGTNSGYISPGSGILLGVMSPHPEKYFILGVVSNGRDLGLDTAAEPEIYLPGYGLHAVLLVRTSATPETAIDAIQSVIHSVDPGQSVYNVQSLDRIIAGSTTRQKMTAELLVIFAALSLGVAAIGIYGVMAFSVVQRRREIGVRMAVGAGRSEIVYYFLRLGLKLTSMGILAGLVAGLSSARILRSQLFETSTVDSIAVVFAVLTLAAAGALAAWIPARRAASTNPVEALRSE